MVRRNLLVWHKQFMPTLVANLIDPLIYLLGLGYGLGTLLPQLGGVPYVAFLASGVLCNSTMNTASSEGLHAAYSRLGPQRTWEGILNTPMRVADIVIGEWLFAALKSLATCATILIVMYGLGIVHGFRPLVALPVGLLTGLCFGGVALVFCVRARAHESLTYYFPFFITPMMLISGVFFPAERLPAPLHALSQALPLVHCIALARAVTLGLPIAHPVISVLVPVAYGVFGVCVAVRISNRRLTR